MIHELSSPLPYYRMGARHFPAIKICLFDKSIQILYLHRNQLTLDWEKERFMKEYKVITGWKYAEIESKLNALAEDGWRLAGMTQGLTEDDSEKLRIDKTVLVMEREKPV